MYICSSVCGVWTPRPVHLLVYTFVYRYYPGTRNITFRQPIHLYIQNSMHLFIALCLYALYVYYMYRFKLYSCIMAIKIHVYPG